MLCPPLVIFIFIGDGDQPLFFFKLPSRIASLEIFIFFGNGEQQSLSFLLLAGDFITVFFLAGDFITSLSESDKMKI